MPVKDLRPAKPARVRASLTGVGSVPGSPDGARCYGRLDFTGEKVPDTFNLTFNLTPLIVLYGVRRPQRFCGLPNLRG
jgi:hypothetical protein